MALVKADLQVLREKALNAFQSYLQGGRKDYLLFHFENWLEEVVLSGDWLGFKEILTFLQDVAEKDKELFLDLVNNKLFIEELISWLSNDFTISEVARESSRVKAKISISLKETLPNVFFDGFVEFSVSGGRIIVWIELALFGDKNAGKLGYVFSWNELRWLKPFVITN